MFCEGFNQKGIILCGEQENPMEKIEITLPISLPTWNRLLSMDKWQRKKTRDMVHHAIYLSIRYGGDWPIQMEYRGKLLSMDSFCAEYYKMIRPNSSGKSATAKKKQPIKKKKPSSL